MICHLVGAEVEEFKVPVICEKYGIDCVVVSFGPVGQLLREVVRRVW